MRSEPAVTPAVPHTEGAVPFPVGGPCSDGLGAHYRRKGKHHDTEPERGRGRPVEKELPDLIPDTTENIMRAVLTTPPKREDEWCYLKLNTD